MSIWPKFFSILLLFGAGFLFGYQMAEPPPSGEGIVAVKFVNNSGSNIQTLRLSHDNGITEVKELLDKTTTTVKFYSPRETSYRIEVIFDDGRATESGVRHISYLQNVTETVKESEIVPEFIMMKK